MIPHINLDIAQRLREVAQLFQDQNGNYFRIQAYRHAAETLEQTEIPVDRIWKEDGTEGLKRLPRVGDSIARAIAMLIRTGKLPMLERLRGDAEPITILSSIAGIGKRFAKRLHHELEIDSLEDLEMAIYDGRLQHMSGIGEKRLQGILASVSSRLGRVRGFQPVPASHVPPVDELLDVDREYREKTEAGILHTLAPRRFNPTGEAWLPILHTQRGERHYTALFSNTARAHQQGKTHDWVVIYQDDGQHDLQCTVITAEWGVLQGRRIVRGRESECSAYYFYRKRSDEKTNDGSQLFPCEPNEGGV